MTAIDARTPSVRRRDAPPASYSRFPAAVHATFKTLPIRRGGSPRNICAPARTSTRRAAVPVRQGGVDLLARMLSLVRARRKIDGARNGGSPRGALAQLKRAEALPAR
nr:hypothetical protein [Pseudoxanthomonas sp.]